MKCPFCGLDNTRVIDSRPADDNSSIRRRRLCDECGKRFTTYEKIEMMPIIVIKKDDNREPYDREKIVAGIVRSCHKRNSNRLQAGNSGGRTLPHNPPQPTRNPQCRSLPGCNRFPPGEEL